MARLVVTLLPGTSGVAFDYDVISPEGEALHREHSMLVTASSGPPVLLLAYEGDSPAALLREIEPGLFAHLVRGRGAGET